MALTHEEIVKALRSLKPGASYNVSNLVVNWTDSSQSQPSADELEAEDAKIKKAYTDNKYQRDRAVAHASIADQLDQIYWDKKNGTTTWVDAVTKVKSDNPKP